MRDILTERLAQRGWLLADGATGTNLFNMGLEAGEAPELWNTDAPDKVRALYRGSIEAGCDLFLTNSFGSNAARLKLHGAQARVVELSRAAAELARDEADKAPRAPIVAGSVGPTGEILEPLGELSIADATAIFAEQMEGLKAGGADILWIETMSSADEFRAAADAAAETGLPWAGTMSFDTAGRTMMGVTAPELARIAAGRDPAPVAVGANCGVGASDLLRTVLGLAGANAGIPIIAKGNAGIPKFVHGHIHYDGTPELMADYAELARNCGASIIGGCCGTTPEHLRHMREALESRPVSAAPSLDEIAARLGAFSSADDGSDATAAPGGARRERRRGRRAA